MKNYELKRKCLFDVLLDLQPTSKMQDCHLKYFNAWLICTQCGNLTFCLPLRFYVKSNILHSKNGHNWFLCCKGRRKSEYQDFFFIISHCAWYEQTRRLQSKNVTLAYDIFREMEFHENRRSLILSLMTSIFVNTASSPYSSFYANALPIFRQNETFVMMWWNFFFRKDLIRFPNINKFDYYLMKLSIEIENIMQENHSNMSVKNIIKFSWCCAQCEKMENLLSLKIFREINIPTISHDFTDLLTVNFWKF